MEAGTGAGVRSGVPCHQICCPLLLHSGMGWHSPSKGSQCWSDVGYLLANLQSRYFPFPLLWLQAAAEAS